MIEPSKVDKPDSVVADKLRITKDPASGSDRRVGFEPTTALSS